MIDVSEAWKEIQPRFLLPETHIEIDCTITDVGAQESATATGEDEAIFSNVSGVLDDDAKTVKYATTELNFWSLDGTMAILDDSAPYVDAGYVSNSESEGGVTLTLPEVHPNATSGVTITWAGRYNEYPTSFTVVAKNGDEIVAEVSVTDNTDQVSVVFATLKNYDSISISVGDWVLPYRRARIEKVIIGHVLTFRKTDVLSYSHEQTGHLNTGELPKNSIEFTLDNTDGRWNPSSPSGLEQYLSERQKLKVRYGLDVNGVVEWIKAGTFYLSEWRVPSNGLEAKFAARDIFEYLLNEIYPTDTGMRTGTLHELIEHAFESAGVPDDFEYILDDSLKNHTATLPEGEHTCAEVVQMCANAARCIVYQDRDGVLHVEPMNTTNTGYVIPLSLSYSHPEIELSKPLKNVSVSYGERGTYTLSVGGTGETQTVSNPLVSTEAQAGVIAEWVKGTMNTRKTVSGEYRSDPRLDVFDVVVVQSKYGELSNVAITDIKYTFSGSFKGNYTGRVLEVATS